MPLSDHEQRLLDEIEQALYAEDPKFVSHVRTSRSRSRSRVRRDVVLCIVGVLLGLGLVLIGLVTTVIAISVVGFVLLVGSSVWAVQAIRTGTSGSSAVTQSGPDTSRAPKQSGLRTRMEDRLRRRFDEN